MTLRSPLAPPNLKETKEVRRKGREEEGRGRSEPAGGSSEGLAVPGGRIDIVLEEVAFLLKEKVRIREREEGIRILPHGGG